MTGHESAPMTPTEVTAEDLLWSYLSVVDHPFTRSELIATIYAACRSLRREGLEPLVDFSGELHPNQPASERYRIYSQALAEYDWVLSNERLVSSHGHNGDEVFESTRSSLLEELRPATLDQDLTETLRRTLIQANQSVAGLRSIARVER